MKEETVEMDIEELNFIAHLKIDALTDLLIKKGIISEDEISKEMDKLYDEYLQESESNEQSQKS